MGFSLGIVGLPNVGKSTLFNALSKAKVDVSNYPFCTIDPNIGIAEVADERLSDIAKIIGSKKAIPTVIEFIDIAGLVKGAHKGEGLGNQFLSHIRETSAIAQVVRCFSAPDIVHVEGEANPERDIGLIEAELILADLATIDKRFEPVKKAIKTGDKNILKLLHLLEKIKEALDRGRPARELLPSINLEDIKLTRELNLLTIKPVLYVANTDESGNLEQIEKIKKFGPTVSICAKLEAEISELSQDDAHAYLKEIGMSETALKRLIRSGYEMLDLITFFTANDKEARAWTVKRGAKAPEAAGCVHSDMERGFIAAEIVSYKDLIENGSYAKAKEKGLVHTQGKSYEIQDGDLVFFKFV